MITRASKYLALILRHNPNNIAPMDENGWVPTEWFHSGDHQSLTPPCALTFAVLCDIVETNTKQRFEFSESKNFIRARQGHSVDVNLELQVLNNPPDILFHGTCESAVPEIQRSGLLPMSRRHVHLSGDRETARVVGARHGKPVVLPVLTRGLKILQSTNGVFLTEYVPANLIVFPFPFKEVT